MKVRVIIPVHNNLNYTRNCLNSVFKSTIFNLLDIWVIDSASTDGTREFCQSLKEVTYIRLEENKGFACAVNKGFDMNADYDYALILNNDTIVPTTLFERMLDCMKDERVGMVGPKSNFAGGQQGIDYNCCKPEDTERFNEELYQKSFCKAVEVGVLVGLCLLIRKETLKETGYFDEIFSPGMFEDVDLSLRARLLGRKLCLAEGCFIYHFGSKTMNENTTPPVLIFKINQERFFNKWKTIFKIGQKKKIVGTLRVRNGMPYVEKTLEKVSQFCDNIVVLVSKDSNDGTFEACKKFPKVTRLEKGEAGYHEYEDRNTLLQWAKELNPDWVYCIDHDEILEDKAIKRIQELINVEDPMVKGFYFKICHFWNDENHYRIDGLWGDFWQCRLFRVFPNDEIEKGLIHTGSHPYISAECLRNSFFRIKHYGNLNTTDRIQKYKRYTEVDTVKDVKMILGRWHDYYCRIYNKHKLEDSDYYRHIIDETGLKKEKWVEDNNVSLCVIVKNEATYIENCVKSVKPLVDEVIVVDTGSTDNTKEVAEKIGAKVYDFKWNDDFSAARNFSLQQCTGRWILRLDADEVIENHCLPFLFNMLQQEDIDAYLFPIRNILKADGSDWVLSETCRLFKNSPYIYYSGKVHEELEDSLDNLAKIKKCTIIRSPFQILHLGYLRSEEEREKKYDYYAQLALKEIEKTPLAPKPYYSLAVHYYHIGQKGKALKYYLKSIKVGDFWMAYNDLGVMFLQRGNISKAKYYLTKTWEKIKNDRGINKIYREKVIRNLKSVDNFNDIINKMMMR